MNSNLLSAEQEILNIFKGNLKIESKVMTIDTLFGNPRKRRSIKEDPYYQRNYVWDEDKASYFIESILLGTEIPPLVFFSNEKNTEVIDGRQRFETIERFIKNKFHLTKGLTVLKDLRKKTFDELSLDIQDIFWDTKLRIIEFSVLKDSRLTEQNEDFIKKEIFRRYNSGITPLQRAEVDKAYYINNDVNEYFKNKINNNQELYSVLLDLFFVEREKEKIGNNSTIEKIMLKIRSLLVLHQIPIKYYSTLKGRDEIKKLLFEILASSIESENSSYNDFVNKINILKTIKEKYDQKNLSSNRLVFETLFWALNVIEIERGDLNIMKDHLLLDKLVQYISINSNDFTLENNHFAKETLQRHVTIASFFEQELSINFNLYLYNSKEFIEEKKELFDTVETDANKLSELETLRLNRPDASTTTIEDIIRQMMRKRFLIRPSYQRGEAINRAKASSLIESILLGIHLPPIFIFKRNDGVSEVIDGQQRLLSILGYIGQSFMDEDGEIVYSEKNEYKLNKLKFFPEYEGKKFFELPEEIQNTIYEFNLTLVTIDSKINPTFDPIDLFIRLNNKPFPIRENTFEMWNSYMDKEIISFCKEKASKYSSWFYARLNNKRMENEELFIILSYLDYKYTNISSNVSDFLDIYQQKDRVNSRIKDKGDITKILDNTLENVETNKKFMKSLKNSESFIKKVRTLLVDREVENIDSFLKSEIESVFCIGSRRTLQDFYLLWYLIKDVSQSTVLTKRNEIKKEIISIFSLLKNLNPDSDNQLTEEFFIKAEHFFQKFELNKRTIILNASEKEYIIESQKNLCPLCNGLLFSTDEIEVDHITPLSVGGREGITNMQITHKLCNRQKGNKMH